MFGLFTSRNLDKDRLEVSDIMRKYGDEGVEILNKRRNDQTLSRRSRRH